MHLIISQIVDIVKDQKQVEDTSYEAVNMTWFKEYNDGYKCFKCGYDACERALDFHHIDPKQKKDRLDTFKRWLRRRPKWFQAKVRTTSYVILCSNCHRELHAGLWKADIQPNRHQYDNPQHDDPIAILWGKGRYGT